jgi:hypothetical protein
LEKHQIWIKRYSFTTGKGFFLDFLGFLRRFAIGMRLLTTIGALFASGALALAANPLVTWDFNSDFPDELEGTILAPNAVASVSAVEGVGGVNLLPSVIFSYTNIGPSAGGGNVLPYALGTSNGAQLGVTGFTVSPDPTRYASFKFSMDTSFPQQFSLLDSISLDLANGGTSLRGIEVTYRIGNSGSFISLGTTATPTNSSNQFGRFTFSLNTPVSLSPSDLVEFRVLGFANDPTFILRLDNVTISAIPEPVKVTLIAGVGILCWRIRRAMQRL